MTFPSRTVLVLTGPTGIGKTELSRALAERYPLEIVSADSRQIYRYMDIGTAKPSAEMRREIPHHFIDILDPDEDYSAGQYSDDARQVIEGIFQRGRLPLVVGGSGLYIRALVEGFFKARAEDPALRARLQERLEAEGIEPLYAELQAIDPRAAIKIHPNNTRRVIRALEVCLAARRPITRLQEEQPDPAPFRSLKLCLTTERKALYARIARRCEEMFEAGLVGEVQKILDMGYDPSNNSLNSVGYKEVVAYLQGAFKLPECIELVKQNTRRYAKRQYTWFRNEPALVWLEKQAAGDLLKEIAGRLTSLRQEIKS
ncbi:MAG: tRNA (adenosine(37)-N6)-dimethylallyltransferase MiaA [Calditrichaeota bacterium]|nr:tRNA (adenosine(37)-N6)-dimethylallyltransferase MiaA [Calditrichota bacterium]MCB0303512.1 tRNA (adenosine(37)-N6)-dimethylallyltransferase MiaA [Calditrichota bacterium]MCB0311974.1 tRNA (adenosine(37)-N6)-dimethylallyltransferase MiaA [Calditrichota bacterium]MCB9086945.1 tRNA (adenosine(37)-N6)-dimethylallyltransferase MiaA [Calditrichia bacterium]